MYSSKKRVGFFVGVCFMINAITGSGIPFISGIFQDAGYVPTLLMFALFTYISIQSSFFIIRSMQMIPGNRKFEGSIEFTTLVNFYFQGRFYLFFIVMFLISLGSNTVESVVITSQTVDMLLIRAFGKTCGLGFKSGLSFICTQEIPETFPSPFGNTKMLFTPGFLVVLVAIIPFWLHSLEENMSAQVIFFLLAIVTVLSWVGISLNIGIDSSRVPAFGKSYLYLTGTIMLNMATSSVIPSWINLKKPSVDYKSVIVTSILGSTLIYLLGGYLPVLALDVYESKNFNISMMKSSLLGEISTYLFPFATLVPSIPINMMVCADNLRQEMGAKNKALIIFIAFVLPCIICIPLQTGTLMIEFVSWTTVLFSNFVNFIIGPIMYMKSLNFNEKFQETRVLSTRQAEIIFLVHNVPSDISEHVKPHLQDKLVRMPLKSAGTINSNQIPHQESLSYKDVQNTIRSENSGEIQDDSSHGEDRDDIANNIIEHDNEKEIILDLEGILGVERTHSSFSLQKSPETEEFVEKNRIKKWCKTLISCLLSNNKPVSYFCLVLIIFATILNFVAEIVNRM